MKAFYRRFALPLAALLFVTGVTVFMPACETVKGAGKDVQNVGEAGERAIDGK